MHLMAATAQGHKSTKKCRNSTALAVCLCVWLSTAAAGQVPGKVDFKRDVQPIFQEHCIGCHGPAQQMNGFRLDRRRDAMRGGTITMIGPGNSEGSRLYLRLTGNRFGLQMPPAGPLSSREIEIIKNWIDQGAEWPDDVAGDASEPLPDPKAVRLIEALRAGNASAFRGALREDPAAARGRGPGGSTPLMFAALYGTADAVRALLDSGADPNARNHAGATALMWAVDDAQKVRLLLERGADANARSTDNRTPLVIAAGRPGAAPVVRLLLDHGADPSFIGVRGLTPLAEAAYAGDETVLQMLINAGADTKSGGRLALQQALMMNCHPCAERLIGFVDRPALGNMLIAIGPPRAAEAPSYKMLLERGADPNAKNANGQTALMVVSGSDTIPAEIIRDLIDRGADVHARNIEGASALAIARLHQKAVADLLVQSGAQDPPVSPPPDLKTRPAGSARQAFDRSIALLQQTDIAFVRKSGCVSCHNNSLPGMSIQAARKNRLPVNESLVSLQAKRIGSYFEDWRERVLQGIGIPGDVDTISYLLLGMAGIDYPPDAATDALARYLKNRQMPDGRWKARDHRPPLSTGDIEITARAMRAIQIYAPRAHRAEYAGAVRRAASWLATAQPQTTQDRAFRLLALKWAEQPNNVIRDAARRLLSEQREDGGWAQIPSLSSDAYATGQALYALAESRTLGVDDDDYKRGVRFLLSTQLEDGSWYVRSRVTPFMPYFESEFPHGTDQFISAAATSWAIMALAPAAR